MRMRINDVRLTDRVLETLSALQLTPDVPALCIGTLDALTRSLISDEAADLDDSAVMARLKTLQALRRDILALSGHDDAESLRELRDELGS